MSKKSKALLVITGIMVLIGTVVYLSSNSFHAKMVSRAAQKQAVAWCADKYGLTVSVISTRVHYNNPVMGGFYFFTPNPNYGPTKSATVTVSDGSRAFQVHCDTDTRQSRDDYQQDRIMADLKDYIQEDLGLRNLVRLTCTYGRSGRENHEIEYLYTGDIADFLTHHTLSAVVLECVGDDFSHLTAREVLGPGSYFSRYVVLLSYRTSEDIGAVTIPFYPVSDDYENDGAHLDSYCLLTNLSSGSYETEHRVLDQAASEQPEEEAETVTGEESTAAA